MATQSEPNNQPEKQHHDNSLRYISRPDLSPPKLHITLPADPKHVSPGYIMITPCPLFDASPGGTSLASSPGPAQQGAYILRQSDGDLIWSSMGYLGGWAANFHATTYKGRPVLQCFTGVLAKKHAHAYGVVVLLDGSTDKGYEVLEEVKPVRSLAGLISFHEFRVLDSAASGGEEGVGDECGTVTGENELGKGKEGEGTGGTTALVQIHQPRLMDLAQFGGKEGQRWVVEDIFQEIDIETNKVIFQASSLSFASPADSCLPLSELSPQTGTSPDNSWDYFHTNSLDKDSKGDYLVSGRHMSAIYKISGQDGSLIWQLGGKNPEKSSFRLLDGLGFAFQHHARFRSSSSSRSQGHGDEIMNEDGAAEVETISLFDNHFRSDQQHWGKLVSDSTKNVPQSSGLIIELNHREKTARQVARFVAPTTESPCTQGGKGLSVGSQGNLQILPDGNVFINWGVEGAVSEYRYRTEGTEPEPIFHAFLDSRPGTQSYRGFKCPWEGTSREKIAVVALSTVGRRGKKAKVFISWNGDTKTREWGVFRTNNYRVGDFVLVGKKERVSFETEIEVDMVGVPGTGSGTVTFPASEDLEKRIFVVAFDAEGKEIGRSESVAVLDDVGTLGEGFHSEANKVCS